MNPDEAIKETEKIRRKDRKDRIEEMTEKPISLPRVCIVIRPTLKERLKLIMLALIAKKMTLILYGSTLKVTR